MESTESITGLALFAISSYEQLREKLSVSDKKYSQQELRQLFDSCDIVKAAAPHKQNQYLIEGTYRACIGELTFTGWNATDGDHFILRR